MKILDIYITTAILSRRSKNISIDVFSEISYGLTEKANKLQFYDNIWLIRTDTHLYSL